MTHKWPINSSRHFIVRHLTIQAKFARATSKQAELANTITPLKDFDSKTENEISSILL